MVEEQAERFVNFTHPHKALVDGGARKQLPMRGGLPLRQAQGQDDGVKQATAKATAKDKKQIPTG